MSLIHIQRWLPGNSEPAFKADGDFFGVAEWVGSGTEDYDPNYPDVISSENVQVNTGAGQNGENVVDVGPANGGNDRTIAGIVLHPDAWPSAGAGSNGVSDQGCCEFDQYCNSSAGEYWPVITLANGLYVDHIALIMDNGTARLYSTGDEVWSGPIANGWHSVRLTWRLSSGASPPDGLLRLSIDGTVQYESDTLSIDLGAFGPLRAIWFGYFGLAGALGTVRIYDDIQCGGEVGPPYPPRRPPETPFCETTTRTGNGGQGNSGCNPGGVGFTPQYAGPFGTVPQHADPIDGESLAGKRHLKFWIEVVHPDYPSGVVTTYRRSFDELAHQPTYQGGRKPGGVLGISDIEHGLGNEQGGFEAATVDIEYSDAHDRLIRELLDDQELEGDECRIKCCTAEGAAAGTPPHVLARAVVQKPFIESALRTRFSAVDRLFSEFGPFGPGRTFPSNLVPEDAFLGTPAETLKLFLPVGYGELSDAGAVDPLTGVLSMKGRVPLHYAGTLQILTEGSSAPPYDPMIAVPSSTGIVGAPFGAWTSLSPQPTFFVVALKDGRMSHAIRMTPLTVSDGYDPTPHGYALVWNASPDPEVDGYIAFVAEPFTTWNPVSNPSAGTAYYKQIAATTPADPPYAPDWDYAVEFSAGNDGTPWPPPGDPPPPSMVEWGFLIAFGHAIFDIYHIFGSDLGSGDGNEPSRILLDPNSRADVLCPFISDAWPFPTTYLDIIGADGATYRVTGVLARGPLLDDHIAGRVNMAINCMATEDVGDGTGLPIVDAHAVEQHVIENHWLNNYKSGLWVTNATAPRWEDGTYMVRSSSFAARQAYTASRVGGRGLTASWYVPGNSTKGLQEWVREWNRSTESRLGISKHGQVVVGGIDETLDTSTWPRLIHQTDLFGPFRRLSGEDRENISVGVCDYDPDKAEFKGPTVTERSPTGIAKYKNREKRGERVESVILRETAQLRWVLKQRIDRLKVGATTIEIDGTTDLLDLEIGQGIRLTTIEGTGPSGYVDRPMLLLRRRIRVSARLVTLTLLDLGDILIAADVQFVIGDEDASPSTAQLVGTESNGDAFVIAA